MLTTLPPDAVCELIQAIGAPVFVVAVEPEAGFRFVAVNRRLEALSGLRDADLCGRSLQDVLPSAAANRLRTRLEECAAAAVPIDYEDFLYNDGVHWVKVSLTPLLADDGRVARIMGVSQDITARHGLEQALAAERAIFRELAQLSSDWFWMTDETDRFVPFPAIGAGDGVAELGAVGLARRDLLDTRVPAEDMPEIEAAVAARRPFRNLVYPQRQADGRALVVSISGNPRFDAGGRYLGYIGVCTDITARRNWMKLQYGRQKLEALGQMAGGLAHELNNLLQPMLSFATRARRIVGDESPAAPLLDDIAASGRQARDIVRGVLTFSRHDRAEQKPVVLSEAVCRAVDFAAGVLPSTVRVERSIEPLPDTAAVRTADVAQVIMNLVSNAVDATDGRGQLTIALRRTEVPGDPLAEERGLASGAYAVLRVADDGCGMEAGVLANVFDPFFTTKPVGEGTGLGLSVVYGIARGWGGDVVVTSAPGEGAAFEVFVPLCADELPSSQRQARDIAV